MFQINTINNINKFYNIDNFIKDQLYTIDNDFHKKYNNNIEISREDWNNEIYDRFQKNVIYLIVIKNNNLCGYASYIEDTTYKNFYIKNLIIDSKYINKITVLKIIIKELLNLFMKSKYKILRLSTHKNNSLMNSICTKRGFIKSESKTSKYHYIYSISRDKINNNYFHYYANKKF